LKTAVPIQISIIASVSRQFKTIQIVSWGADQWAELSKRVANTKKTPGLMEQSRQAPEKILAFLSNGIEIPYLPLPLSRIQASRPISAMQHTWSTYD
jgi:hypothetical protein